MIAKLCKCQTCRRVPSVTIEGPRMRISCSCYSTVWFTEPRALVKLWNEGLPGALI